MFNNTYLQKLLREYRVRVFCLRLIRVRHSKFSFTSFNSVLLVLILE
ncbi:Uncharacterized protein FWK35_00025573 [Aphis craccivora]|uniref:Uncharacterized protein n=1 Tax=Aphis craccivora TaxID=307492 RepID=A0A6G0ZCH6_APHCR|nr:Uncharacterized protein FWK35_00025573 [Aphis craccivora]